MLSSERLREIVTQEVSLPPWDLHFDCINCERTRAHTEFMGCTITFADLGTEHLNHVWYVQARLWRADSDTSIEDWGAGSKILLENTMTEGDVVKKCFVAIRDYAEHEVREGFQWKHRRILGPHIAAKALWDVANVTEVQ